MKKMLESVDLDSLAQVAGGQQTGNDPFQPPRELQGPPQQRRNEGKFQDCMKRLAPKYNISGGNYAGPICDQQSRE